MPKFNLQCSGCQHEREPMAAVGLCDSCQQPYDVVYESVGHSEKLLPLANSNAKINFGITKTPIVALPVIAEMLGIKQLYAKLEYYFPTGSFKDRGSMVLISGAVENGIKEFIEDSSGNAGASLAAFAARAGIKATIFLPQNVSKNKLNQIQIYGTATELVEGTRQNATDMALAKVAASGKVYLSHNYSPYFIEGMKEFVYELDIDLINRIDAILFPVGNGSLLLGTWRAFKEQLSSKQIAKIPALCAVQSDAVCPIHLALEGEVKHPQTYKTIAAGIAVSKPPRLKQIVEAVQNSNGVSAIVNDESILYWQKKLAQLEGVFCEATAAAVIAGIEVLIKQKKLLNNESCVLIPITGTGLKEVPH